MLPSSPPHALNHSQGRDISVKTNDKINLHYVQTFFTDWCCNNYIVSTSPKLLWMNDISLWKDLKAKRWQNLPPKRLVELFVIVPLMFFLHNLQLWTILQEIVGPKECHVRWNGNQLQWKSKKSCNKEESFTREILLKSISAVLCSFLEIVSVIYSWTCWNTLIGC